MSVAIRSVTAPLRRPLGAALVAASLLVGCTDASPDDAPDQDAEVAEEPVVDDSDGSDEAATDEDATDAEPGDAEVVEGSPRPDLGLPPMTLLTPSTGEGPRPVLRWEPVAGAETYAVMVYAGAGEAARWSWRGEDTSVRVGFVEDTSVGGPNVIDGMTWSVLAFDADDEALAQSNERPLGP